MISCFVINKEFGIAPEKSYNYFQLISAFPLEEFLIVKVNYDMND